MTRTLVVIGTHKEEADFGRALKNYVTSAMSDLVAKTASEFEARLIPGIFFFENPKPSLNESNGQSIMSRKLANLQIYDAVERYSPDLVIDVHTTISNHKYLRMAPPNTPSEQEQTCRFGTIKLPLTYTACPTTDQSHIHVFSLFPKHLAALGCLYPDVICEKGSWITDFDRDAMGAFEEARDPILKIEQKGCGFYFLESLINSAELPRFDYSAALAGNFLKTIHSGWTSVDEMYARHDEEIPF